MSILSTPQPVDTTIISGILALSQAPGTVQTLTNGATITGPATYNVVRVTAGAAVTSYPAGVTGCLIAFGYQQIPSN